MFGLGMPELLIIGAIVSVALLIKKSVGRTGTASRQTKSTGESGESERIDASIITSITMEGACPDCHGQGQVWCKAKEDSDGNAYIYHNKCGWGKDTGMKWDDFVAQKISEGYINYTERSNLIAPWDIRPGMATVLIGYKGKRRS